ncbi:MAG TPA: OmpA family protein, partial [Mycobacteriales bacterium]|nr:OmpA family protein [Mycobacteriales bacterium]
LGDDATLTGAHDFKLSAATGNDMTTHATGGAGGATAVTPVIAISISNNDAVATLGTLSSGELKIDGALLAAAAHKGSADTSAIGDTKSGDTGVGISLALTVGSDTVLATTNRDLNAGGAVSFSARTASSVRAVAKASVAGGDEHKAAASDGKDQGGGISNQVHNQAAFADKRGAAAGASGASASKSDGKATADTQNRSVQVAGAVAVNVIAASAKAYIPDGRTIVAGSGAGVTNGTLTLKAGNDTSTVALADGSATIEGGSSQSGGARQAVVTASTPLTDVNVTQLLGQQRETTIAVNPANTQNIIVAPNNSPGIFGTPSRDSVWVSTDGGQKWTEKVIPIPAAGFGSHGDPSLAFSRDGSTLMYVHLVDKSRPHGDHAVVYAVSHDGGITWAQADTGVIGSFDADEDHDHNNDANDKEFIAVGPDVLDPTKDRFAVTWQRHGVIYVSTYTAAEGWSTPAIVGGIEGTIATGDGTDPGAYRAPSGHSIDAIPRFGPNGELYVVWEEWGTTGVSHVMFDVSYDGGKTWGGGWDQRVFFDTDKSDLQSDDKLVLEQTIALLKADPTLHVTIVGNADTRDSDTHNNKLSDDRAASVWQYFHDAGIADDRMVKIGLGENHLAIDQTGDVQGNRNTTITLDRVIYTGNVNVSDDPFNGGVGLDGTDSDYEIPAQPERGIWMGLSIDVDKSGGVNNGRIYVALTDQGDRDGDPDAANATDHNNTDIFVIASDDDGRHWNALGAAPV